MHSNKTMQVSFSGQNSKSGHQHIVKNLQVKILLQPPFKSYADKLDEQLFNYAKGSEIYAHKQFQYALVKLNY